MRFTITLDIEATDPKRADRYMQALIAYTKGFIRVDLKGSSVMAKPPTGAHHIGDQSTKEE
jgi:hypothetical protein